MSDAAGQGLVVGRVAAGAEFAGKCVLVMGLGSFGGGVGVSRFLVERGAKVTVTDLADAAQLAPSLEQLEGLDIAFHLGGHRQEDLLQADLIVINPAVPKQSPWRRLAGENDIPLTSEINLFFERCPAPIVGVTGSNGKSTTAAMIDHVLRQTAKSDGNVGHQRVWLGGNIGGQNLLEKVDAIGAHDVVVLELSSFQLDDLARIGRSPHWAVLTNLSPNHLDWHGSMADYVLAKQTILRFQTARDHAILNRDDRAFETWARLGQGRMHWYPGENHCHIPLSIPGGHNQANAAAAVALAQVMGIVPEIAGEALKEFKGLPHRLELVGEIGGVRYYNDSIATTPESVIAALDAFSEAKVLILGGYDKGISFDALVDKLVADAWTASAVERVVLIGQMADQLAEQIAQAREKQGAKLPICEKAGSMEEAVTLAKGYAQPGMLVLLSPACASYDMFKNFQERGERFSQLVKGE